MSFLLITSRRKKKGFEYISSTRRTNAARFVILIEILFHWTNCTAFVVGLGLCAFTSFVCVLGALIEICLCDSELCERAEDRRGRKMTQHYKY